MSQYPRVVVSGIWLSWPPGAVPQFLRAGTWLDCIPGSAHESAIGASNLRVPSARELAQGENADHACHAN